MIIKPQVGPQEDFLASSADIAIIGGAAGGGKTWALLVEPCRHIKNEDFGAVIFRRTYPQITVQGGMWDESMKLYPYLNGVPKVGDLAWYFYNGGRVSFRHLQHEQSVNDYYGAQIPLIVFDQLEQFSEKQFFYMLARNRTTCGVVPYVRGSCNPDPDSWLASFLSYWIDDQTGYADQSKAGDTRHFTRKGDTIVWHDCPQYAPDGRVLSKSIAFYPASVYDNAALLDANPAYLTNLESLATVERERLLLGNWRVRYEAGNLFNRAWFDIVLKAPTIGVDCRFWDFAATEKKTKKQAATASVKMRYYQRFYVTDCTEDFLGPAAIDKHVLRISIQDAMQAKRDGVHYMIRWEIEPGSAGKREDTRLRQLLRIAFARLGLEPPDAEGVGTGGEDKIQRWKPYAQSAYIGDVAVVNGGWNKLYLDHLHNQPQDRKDIADASAGTFNALCFSEQVQKQWNEAMKVRVGY